MKNIEQHISQYIESQFPSVFKEEGPQLVQFVKAYYEWMESTGQPLFHSRRLPSYRDIDETLDEFVTFFKLKYLPNIQFTTASSRRLFVKNALDFHRSKGSSRSVELFFKLIYGVSASIYYPGDDLFRASDGEWVVPVYLEISPSPMSKSFVGQQIVGVNSLASAFVQAYNRIRIKGKYIEVFYLSDLSGTFEAGEILKIDQVVDGAPKVIGSASTFTVVSGGADFRPGERIGVVSENGQFATGVVTDTDSVVGAANVALVTGGFGYNSNSEVIISDKTLQINGISNGIMSRLGTLEERYPNGDIASTATVVGVDTNHILTASITNGSLTIGQRITQGSVSGVITRIDTVGTNALIHVENVASFFVSGGATTPTGTVNVSSYSALVGIANVSGPGSYSIGNDVLEVNSGITGRIQVVAQTSDPMTFRLGANSRFTNMTQANVSLDYLRDYANTPLNAATYNMPKDPTANSATLMITALRYETMNFGTISNSAITSLYAGSGYARKPFVLIKEQIPYDMKKTMMLLQVRDQQSEFIVGEKLTTGTRVNGVTLASSDPLAGIVRFATPNQWVISERLSVLRQFSEHDPNNYVIIGETSGASARIIKAGVWANTDPIGMNAKISAEAFTASGLVTSINLETSGYGYVDGEQVTFYSLDNKAKTGLARLNVKTHGKGAGYYLTPGGALSGTKHLQDNDYYQEYSYEIRTSIQSDTYRQMFDQVVHVAGTKGFSSYLSVQDIDSTLSIADTSLTLEP